MSGSLQTGLGEQEVSVSEPSSALLISLIDQHDVAALLVNMHTLEFEWTSAASTALDHRLVAGNSLTDLPELQSVLQEPLQNGVQGKRLKDMEAEIKVSVQCTLRPSNCQDSVNEPTTLFAGQADNSADIGLSVPLTGAVAGNGGLTGRY